MDSEGSGTGSRSLDWDLSWGQNGVLIHKSINSYNYDVHHSKLQKSAMVPSIQCSARLSLRGWWLTTGATWSRQTRGWTDKSLLLLDRVLACPDRSLEAFIVAYTFQAECAGATGRSEKLAPALAKAGWNWELADKTVDELEPSCGLIRPRGDPTMGVHGLSAEFVGLCAKLIYVLCAPDHGVPTGDVMAALPSIEE